MVAQKAVKSAASMVDLSVLWRVAKTVGMTVVHLVDKTVAMWVVWKADKMAVSTGNRRAVTMAAYLVEKWVYM